MGRAPCCDKATVKRGPWSPEEDQALRTYVDAHGSGGNWIALPKKAGLKRCGKSCRLRWLNYLRPDIKHGGFTEEEDDVICTLYHKIGSRWSVIASHLAGRTDNDVKNYWNTKLKKRLLAAPPPPPAAVVIPAVKVEAYTCDDFMARALASTSMPDMRFGSFGGSLLDSSFTMGGSTASSSTPTDTDNGGINWPTSGSGESGAFLAEFGLESPSVFLGGYCPAMDQGLQRS